MAKYGVKVNLSEWKKIKKRLSTLETKEVRAGFFREDKYEGISVIKGKRSYNEGVPVAQVAIWNEFGSRANNRKPRPFLTLSFEDIRKDKKILAEAITAVIMGTSYTTALAALGEYYKKIIKKTIDYWFMTGDTNSVSWTKFKGFNKPLEFTKKMLESVKFKIVKRKTDVVDPQWVSMGKE